jgi:hypothetical protein
MDIRMGPAAVPRSRLKLKHEAARQGQKGGYSLTRSCRILGTSAGARIKPARWRDFISLSISQTHPD